MQGTSYYSIPLRMIQKQRHQMLEMVAGHCFIEFTLLISSALCHLFGQQRTTSAYDAIVNVLGQISNAQKSARVKAARTENLQKRADEKSIAIDR